MGLYRGPEADQVGSGVRERQVSSGAADEGVQDSALVHVLQVAQVFAQVLPRGVALQRDTAVRHSGWTKGRRGGEGCTCSVSYSVTSCREPSVSRRTLTIPAGSSGVPSSGFSWVAGRIWIDQSESGRSKTTNHQQLFWGPEES